jgi:hypothetical protein
MFQHSKVLYKNLLQLIFANQKFFKTSIYILGLGETYYELARENLKSATDNKYIEYVELSVKVN